MTLRHTAGRITGSSEGACVFRKVRTCRRGHSEPIRSLVTECTCTGTRGLRNSKLLSLQFVNGSTSPHGLGLAGDRHSVTEMSRALFDVWSIFPGGYEKTTPCVTPPPKKRKGHGVLPETSVINRNPGREQRRKQEGLLVLRQIDDAERARAPPVIWRRRFETISAHFFPCP
ncbi:hypothetical protein DPEC_G00115970 [Dallia pectoralis]|uniref:Uncharacterized protein n=1 Tax=Dallia pectoralis TaxID=75939 RepID=A0ACC2GUP6_DALPE|nr:hypothetical protein DPEC_G00115970 [Dallia pectoralis]